MVQTTELVVEGVEDHVEVARDGVDTTRLPARPAVVSNSDQKPSVVVLVKQLIRASPSTRAPFVSRTHNIHLPTCVI